jgi:hypothetical protein
LSSSAAADGAGGDGRRAQTHTRSQAWTGDAPHRCEGVREQHRRIGAPAEQGAGPRTPSHPRPRCARRGGRCPSRRVRLRGRRAARRARARRLEPRCPSRRRLSDRV